jgi:hypothetical protein
VHVSIFVFNADPSVSPVIITVVIPVAFPVITVAVTVSLPVAAAPECARKGVWSGYRQ